MLHWEDFPEGLQLDLGVASITKASILRFAREFDPQPFHIDEVAARRSHFRGLVASGAHTFALVIRRTCDAFLLDAKGAGSPGVDEVRFRTPVRPGDLLRMRAEVVQARVLRSRPELGILRLAWFVSNQRGEEVLAMKAHLLMHRRPTRQPRVDALRNRGHRPPNPRGVAASRGR
jgi:acyl dehydratase